MINNIISLGHELFHALDASSGLIDGTEVSEGVTRNDYQAVYNENRLRSSMNIPLRTHYKVIDALNGIGTGPSMLINNRNVKPSWYR